MATKSQTRLRGPIGNYARFQTISRQATMNDYESAWLTVRFTAPIGRFYLVPTFELPDLSDRVWSTASSSP